MTWQEQLERLLRHLHTNGGRLVINHYSGSGRTEPWMLGYEFGAEADDSNMAGGAAYASSLSLEQAVADLYEEVRP